MPGFLDRGGDNTRKGKRHLCFWFMSVGGTISFKENSCVSCMKGALILPSSEKVDENAKEGVKESRLVMSVVCKCPFRHACSCSRFSSTDW